MAESATRPERRELAPGLEISRMVTGLWQVADMERDGTALDVAQAATALGEYAGAGFDTFDMADHYGSAELIAGELARRSEPSGRPRLLTKWCPEPGPMTAEVVRAGVQRSLDRLGVETIDLLQLHWWSFEHPGYLDAMKELAELREAGVIGHLGVTNFDTDHLHLLVKHGIPVASNQISFSVLDRRAAGDMSALCREAGIGLLAYGTLAGGFLAERWFGAPEPAEIADWSKMKYKRFIDAVGGWAVLESVLQALATIAVKHEVSVSNVATRWVLEQPAVAAVIVGARIGEGEHRADNLRSFGFALDETDRGLIDAALSRAKPIPGDCGDEYRRPPYLTASGDLSHHLEALSPVFKRIDPPGRPGRSYVSSGSVWEPIAGFGRATRVGDRILVSGTTATHGSDEAVCPGDPAGQTVYILDKIAASISSLGGSLKDVVRTRIYLKDIDTWEPVSRVHGRYFGTICPANTLIEVSNLAGPYDVEIEAEAMVSDSVDR